MKEPARVQAAIELLDLIIAGARDRGASADRLIAAYFRARRYAGSRDRRAVRELVYRAIRACGPVPHSGRAALIALAREDARLHALFDGSRHGPRAIAPDEAAAVLRPLGPWLEAQFAQSQLDAQERAALLERAPLDLRINTLKAQRGTLTLPEAGERLAAPHGVRLTHGTRVEQWAAYREGLVEIQDHASQLVCAAFEAQPGERIIDLCAGAGGKSLALAASMQNAGRILACDVDRARLARLPARAQRAGAAIIETRLLNPGEELRALDEWRGQADAVLVDAPCSGSGTLRRNPESRWRLDAQALARLCAAQDALLDKAAALVRPGGRIGFVTCSLLQAEGASRIAAFRARHPRFRARPCSMPLGEPSGEGTRLTPFQHGTDGFFVAICDLAC